jgi:transposase
VSDVIRLRSQGVSDEVKRIAWRAQERLCGRFRKLTARGKNKNRTVIAIARELSGFIWAIGQEPKLLEH